MQDKPDQKASSERNETNDVRTSYGEVVRRVDLERAAGTPGTFVLGDPDVAGYDGVELARAALAGDQAALDTFHELAGLVLPRVTEHGEGDVVCLVLGEINEKVRGLEVESASVRQTKGVRAMFRATNEAGCNSTLIDAAELVEWILSSEGRAALARRGVVVPMLIAEEGAAVPEREGPLFVRKHDDGSLFLADEYDPLRELDLENCIALDDVALWNSYVTACRARQQAARDVFAALRNPTPSEIKTWKSNDL